MYRDLRPRVAQQRADHIGLLFGLRFALRRDVFFVFWRFLGIGLFGLLPLLESGDLTVEGGTATTFSGPTKNDECVGPLMSIWV